MQANVGRGGAANDLALALVFENIIDILFLQEPWIGADLSRKMSKKHNVYQAHVPQDKWYERPKVIIYVRRNHLLRCIEKRQDQLGAAVLTPDVLFLQMKLDKDTIW